MKKSYKLIFSMVVFLSGTACSFAQQGSLAGNNVQNVQNRQAAEKNSRYRIVRRTCTKNTSCYLLVLLPAINFTKEPLVSIVRTISEREKDKNGLTIWLFDDEKLVRSFATGKREYRNLAFDARGKYIRGGNQEILMFSKERGRLDDLDDVLIINLKEQN